MNVNEHTKAQVMQTNYVLRVSPLGTELVPIEVQRKINQIMLDAKTELSKLDINSSLTINSIEDDDFEDGDTDLDFLEDEVDEANLEWNNTPEENRALLKEVQRVSQMVLIKMSSAGHQTSDPLKAIRSVFPENAEKVYRIVHGDLEPSEELDLTEKALTVFLNHNNNTFITITACYLITCYDVHKLFGLLLAGKTNLDSVLDFLLDEIYGTEFSDLPLDKDILSGTLDFMAQLFNFQFFNTADLPIVDNPMTDLSCLFGEDQKPNLRIIKS